MITTSDYSHEYQLERFDLKKPIKRLFLSIGAMKAGTSWLYANLRCHPDIDCPPIKEIHYFYSAHCENFVLNNETRLSTIKYNANKIFDEKSRSQTVRNLEWCKKYVNGITDDEWFVSLYDRPASNTYCAEFSNLNFVLPSDGWEHVKRISEGQKIILTLRDPLARLWSHVRFHAGLLGRFDEIAHMNTHEISKFIEQHQFWKFGNYANAIALVKTHFSDDDLFFSTFEDIVRNPHEVLNNIYHFLGLNQSDAIMDDIETTKNASAQLAMTEAFREAARPSVVREIAQLRAIGFIPPEQWAVS